MRDVFIAQIATLGFLLTARFVSNRIALDIRDESLLVVIALSVVFGFLITRKVVTRQNRETLEALRSLRIEHAQDGESKTGTTPDVSGPQTTGSAASHSDIHLLGFTLKSNAADGFARHSRLSHSMSQVVLAATAAFLLVFGLAAIEIYAPTVGVGVGVEGPIFSEGHPTRYQWPPVELNERARIGCERARCMSDESDATSVCHTRMACFQMWFNCAGRYECDEQPQACQAETYWTPQYVVATDSNGQQRTQPSDASVKIEIQEDGAGLAFRVCKEGSVFINDVYVWIFDTRTAEGINGGSESLAVIGTSCSHWKHLAHSDEYEEGEPFLGRWMVVSPASSRYSWKNAACDPSGTPTGTCFNGEGLKMKRTCKSLPE